MQIQFRLLGLVIPAMIAVCAALLHTAISALTVVKTRPAAPMRAFIAAAP